MSTLEILGNSHDGHTLWVRLDDDEFNVTVPELAVMRHEVAEHGEVWIRTQPRRHITLDESQVTALINAMNAPQPLWPPITCRYCDTDASRLIKGHPHCTTCARLFAPQEGVR
jgi:hypothetical protein